MGRFLLIEVATLFFHRAGEWAWRRTLVGGHGLLSTLAAHNIGGQWSALAQDNSKMLKLTGPLVNFLRLGWWAALGAYSSAELAGSLGGALSAGFAGCLRPHVSERHWQRTFVRR